MKIKTHLSGFLEKYEQTRKEVNLQSICCAGSNSSSSAQTYTETLQSLIFSSFTLTKHLRSSAHHLKHHHRHHHLARTRDHCFFCSVCPEQTELSLLWWRRLNRREVIEIEKVHMHQRCRQMQTHTHTCRQSGRQTTSLSPLLFNTSQTKLARTHTVAPPPGPRRQRPKKRASSLACSFLLQTSPNSLSSTLQHTLVIDIDQRGGTESTPRLSFSRSIHKKNISPASSSLSLSLSLSLDITYIF